MSYIGRIDESVVRELAAGERVVWSGQPDAGALILDQLYTLTFLWNAGLGYALTLPEVQEHYFSLFGVALMLAFGIYMFGSSVLECLSAASTHYAVTDRRLIVARPGSSRPVICLRLDQIRAAERMSANPERATIRIPLGMVGDGGGGERMDYLKLYGVRQPVEVLRLLTA